MIESRAGQAACVTAVAAAVTAVLSLATPWAVESAGDSFADSHDLAYWQRSWSGWGLAGASSIDRYRPLPVLIAALLVIATVAVLALAWRALDTGSEQWSIATGSLALVLLIISIPIAAHLQGASAGGYPTDSSWGLDLHRTALALITVTALGRPAFRPVIR
jgi:hypothetical protein